MVFKSPKSSVVLKIKFTDSSLLIIILIFVCRDYIQKKLFQERTNIVSITKIVINLTST